MPRANRYHRLTFAPTLDLQFNSSHWDLCLMTQLTVHPPTVVSPCLCPYLPAEHSSDCLPYSCPFPEPSAYLQVPSLSFTFGSTSTIVLCIVLSQKPITFIACVMKSI